MTAVMPGNPETIRFPDRDESAGRDRDSIESSAPRRRLWRIVFHQPLAVVSLAYLVTLVAAALFAGVLAPYDPGATNLRSILSGPTTENLLGTDPLGRDVLSRLIYAGRVSLTNAGIAASTFLLVGVVSGLLAGFLGGWTDRLFTWVVDTVIAVPALIVLLAVVATFGGASAVAMVALGILAVPGFARVIRAVTLAIRQEPYISATRVFGLPTRHVVFKHVLPRVSGPILVHVSLFAGGALIIDAGLAYLGFGPEPPTPTWGGMIIEGAGVIQRQPWLLVPPGVTLGLATLAFALIGDAVRDANAERTGRTVSRPNRSRHLKVVEQPAGSVDAQRPRSSLLSLRNVTVALGGPNALTSVVEHLDLDVDTGETVGLVGESGSGKSITAAAVLGLLPSGGQVTEGSIRFKSAELAEANRRVMRSLRGSQIALISQEPTASLDPVFTVGQQIDELVRRHHGGSRKAVRSRTLDLLAMVSLREPRRVVQSYPHELSGGMAQRVAIAMALSGNPKLLIADEPTTALDVTVQAEILDLLRGLQAQLGMAILLISHNWSVVASTCQRAYVMYAGHVVESCRVAEMFHQPLHPYTRGLLNSTPRRTTPRQRLSAIPGTVPPPSAWPVGCHFAPRCELATGGCRAPIPMFEPEPGRFTRCIHHRDVIPGRADE